MVSIERERSGPGRRAVLRWAWRLFRREWRQQLLMLALVTVAVAAAVAGATVAVNAASASRGERGDAGAMVLLDATNPGAAAAGVAAIRQQFGTVEVIPHKVVAVPGSIEPLDVRAQDPSGVYGHSMLALRDGRYPSAGDEVALTDGSAGLLSATIGERIDVGGVERTVVGRVENPRDLNDEFALIAPNDPAPADSLTVLIASVHRGDSTVEVPAGVPGQAGFEVIAGGTDQAAVRAAVLVATTLAMALVCLIATAGFVVVAQRRQRQLGLLAAIGATERHLRLVMLANGAIVGGAAALVGGTLGVLGWMVAAPAVETAAAHRIDRLDLPWALIAECMGLAVVAATAAAWWPARTMARLPVIAALSRRPARPRSVHRSLVLALALVALGVGGIAAAHPTSDDVRPLVLIAGVLAVVFGVVLASPAAVRALAVPANRLPFAPRLALRDLVRYQARAAAALAAITLALGISVTVVVIAKANEHRSDSGNLSAQQLVIGLGDPRTSPDPNLSAGDRARLDAAAMRIAGALNDPTLFPLDVAMNPATADDARVREPINVATPIDHGFRGYGFPYVATPELLRRYGIDPATVDDGTDLLTSLPGDLVLLDSTVRPDGGAPPTAVRRVALSSFTSAPTSLVTESALRRHGWVRARAGWLVESATPLSSAQIAAARGAAASAGLTVETSAGQDGLATLRTAATAVGALLALAILAMTIGLIRSESARDLRTITATGGDSRTRRTLAASTAGALALLGVVLSTGGAYVALIAAYHADLHKLAPPPAAHLLALAVGLPVVASGAGWLLAGREPRTFSREALD
jgi:putative ABC transport system permease protein